LSSRRSWWRLFTLAAIVIVLAVVVHQVGGGDLLHREGLGRLRQWGRRRSVSWGRRRSSDAYILTAVAFVPALPMSVLAGCSSAVLGDCSGRPLARHSARAPRSCSPATPHGI
jgi:hypothetical protein